MLWKRLCSSNAQESEEPSVAQAMTPTSTLDKSSNTELSPSLQSIVLRSAPEVLFITLVPLRPTGPVPLPLFSGSVNWYHTQPERVTLTCPLAVHRKSLSSSAEYATEL